MKPSKKKSQDHLAQESTAKKWWDSYIRWGGQSFLIDIAGFHDVNWYFDKMTAEDFYERYQCSTHVSAPPSIEGLDSDVKEYFCVVCRDGC